MIVLCQKKQVTEVVIFNIEDWKRRNYYNQNLKNTETCISWNHKKYHKQNLKIDVYIKKWVVGVYMSQKDKESKSHKQWEILFDDISNRRSLPEKKNLQKYQNMCR